MKTKSTKNIQKLFFRGNYRDVLTLGLEESDVPLRDEDFPYLVGALGFNGRKEEAENFYRRREKSLSPSLKIACRFFLGISYCRYGDYAKGRAFISENLWVGRRSQEGADRFYVMQGLGFYRYVCAQFKPALRAAEDAFTSATLARFGYGMALAGDLSGHGLVQTGNVHRGLGRLEEAERVAVKIGDGGLGRSIRMSQIVYRAQFGIAPDKALSELREAFLELDTQNTHAQANLLLEEANQLLLRGRLKEALKTLDETSTKIYRSHHRRYGNLLTLRLAELSYRSGQYASALHSARNVRSLLSERNDRVLLLMAMGIEIKALKKLGEEESLKVVSEKCEQLTRVTHRALSLVILSREKKGGDANLDLTGTPQEDAMALLHSTINAERVHSLGKAVSRVIASGYLSFLYELLQIPHAQSAIVLGLQGKDCAILDQGEVIYRDVRVSRQMHDLLALLGEGEKTKSELVKKVWGYVYHPFRHDPLIFQAVSRLRELLGPRSYWIEVTEDGYRLWPGIRLIDLSTEKSTPAAATSNAISTQLELERAPDLNPRQMKILEMLQKTRFVGVPECLKRFKVTDMTLRRDFTELRKSGLVRRVGRARSTRYELIGPN